MARFLPAVILYNLVLVLSHWPAVVDLTLRNGLAHFVAHVILFVSSLIVWLPILSPLPEIPRLVAGRADGLPVPAIRGPDDPGLVPHLRRRSRSTRPTRVSRTSGARRRSRISASPGSS